MPPPTTSTDLKVSFPEEHVLLLTLNRPEKRNAMSPALSQEIGKVLAWFDEEPSLWCVRAFLSLRGLFIEYDILTFYAWGPCLLMMHISTTGSAYKGRDYHRRGQDVLCRRRSLSVRA